MYELPLKHRVVGEKDGRGRSDITYVLAPEPLRVIAVGPVMSDEIDSATVQKYSEVRVVLLPKYAQVLSTDLIGWQGNDWKVIAIRDFSYGPVKVGGVEVQIGLVRGDSSGTEA